MNWHAKCACEGHDRSNRSIVFISSICSYPCSSVCIRGSKFLLSAAQTLTGIDVLEAQKFAPLAGKRVGLITNQTGIDRNRQQHDRSAGARAGREACGSVQPRARHPRHSRCARFFHDG